MRIYLICIAFLSSLLVVQACRHIPSSNMAAPPRPASEKTIYQAMGRGLMGNAFITLSRPDQRRALEAEYRALEYGNTNQATSWQSTDKTHFGQVITGHPYRVGSQNCRQYSHNFTIGKVIQNVSGSACRNEDGSWTPLT